MSTDFSAVMAERSDKQLAEILTTERGNYQPAAVEAALTEFNKRNLNLNDFGGAAQNNGYGVNNMQQTPEFNLSRSSANDQSQSQSQAQGGMQSDPQTTARKEQANKDMMWGAIWCVGGLIGTFSDTGYIFWGAIVFGAIQFFKGLANS